MSDWQRRCGGRGRPLAAPARARPHGVLLIGMRAELIALNQGAGAVLQFTVDEDIFETRVDPNVAGRMPPRLGERSSLSAPAKALLARASRGPGPPWST